MSAVHVHLLPAVFSPQDVAGGVVVMVDILRASTTMTEALANGASGVVPCLQIEDALALKAAAAPNECLLGGERGGVKIDGFDFGNSPRDYSPDVVAGKTLAFTTTNGTRALHHSQQAAEILIGCFRNLTAVVRYLKNEVRNIDIVCAGTNGEMTSEDVLFGGCLAKELLKHRSQEQHIPDTTRIAIDHWNTQCGGTPRGSTQCGGTPRGNTQCGSAEIEPLHQAIRASQGGQNLIVLGYDEDIRFVSEVDSVHVVAKRSEDGVLRLISASDNEPTVFK